mgnify:FL=1
MKLVALDEKGRRICIDTFFEARYEFTKNDELKEETARKLRTLSRHKDDLALFSEPYGSAHALRVHGLECTYLIVFEVSDDAIFLKKLI